MDDPETGGRGSMSGVAVAVVALLGLAFSLTPIAHRLDAAMLDVQWAILGKFNPRPAPDDIVLVGVDEASVRAIAEPRGLWHEPLGRALLRLASAKPRAIALDMVLPERSFDFMRAGMDRALMVGLAAARQNGPFVVGLTIDSRTRSARPVHAPFLAVLGEERLGIAMTAREADGGTRRFGLLLPTEDGGFPTIEGRLCRALAKRCGDGYINFALGAPFRYVPLKQLLETQDTQLLDKLFRDRIVLIGEAQRFGDRLIVPVNPAGWEPGGNDAPALAVRAQSLRTALLDAAPQDASRPTILVIVTIAALLFLMRNWRLAWITAALAAAGLMAGALLALRAGVVLPVAAALLTLVLAAALRTYREWRGPLRASRR